MDKFSSKERFGFTLIEILIVIAIMGALAVIVVPMILDAPSKARDTQRIENMEKIANFLTEQYARGESLPIGHQLITSDYSQYGGWDEISTSIESDLSNFGGIFPDDPNPDNCFFPDEPDFCGLFIYFRSPALIGRPYENLLFSISARVENTDSGNNDQWWLIDGYDFADSGMYYVIAIGE